MNLIRVHKIVIIMFPLIDIVIFILVFAQTTALINQVFQTFKDSMTGKNSLPSVMKSTLAGTVNTLKILTISGDNDTDQDMKIFYDEVT